MNKKLPPNVKYYKEYQENWENKAYQKNIALWNIWGRYETNFSQQMGVYSYPN